MGDSKSLLSFLPIRNEQNWIMGYCVVWGLQRGSPRVTDGWGIIHWVWQGQRMQKVEMLSVSCHCFQSTLHPAIWHWKLKNLDFCTSSMLIFFSLDVINDLVEVADNAVIFSMQSPLVLARTVVLCCCYWSYPSYVSEERKWLKILWFGSVPCSRKNLSLHRKCKNWKTKNISLFQNPIRKNWCSQKCKIFTLVAFLDFSVRRIFFSKLLKTHVLCWFF